MVYIVNPKHFYINEHDPEGLLEKYKAAYLRHIDIDRACGFYKGTFAAMIQSKRRFSPKCYLAVLTALEKGVFTVPERKKWAVKETNHKKQQELAERARGLYCEVCKEQVKEGPRRCKVALIGDVYVDEGKKMCSSCWDKAKAAG